MPSKVKNVYICSNCDAQFPKWSGRCLECGAWGSLNLRTIDSQATKDQKTTPEAATVVDFDKVNNEKLTRVKIGVGEIDRVLGGGLVPGSLVLLSGEPGIGKSTMVAQIAINLSQINKTTESNQTIYVSGEESVGQVKERLLRLSDSCKNLKFVSETNVEKIIGALIEKRPTLAIIDSIQTVYSSEIPSEAGSVSQIRASAVKFLEVAKKYNIAIVLIGHITKDGQVAGPKTLEHIVDTVVYLESESAHGYRILRASKNRFGSTNELGIFEMTSVGFKEISNPSLVFIEDSLEKISGSIISVIREGTRSFLVELQALASKTVFGYPQRKASGFDLNRLQVLAAVLSKRTKINLNNQDIILNIVGGLQVDDPGLDLAACLAIASSLLNQTVSKKILVLGEVGLGGEIRQVAKLEERLREAEKLGFNQAIIPTSSLTSKKLELVSVKNLEEAIEKLINLD